MIRRLRIFLSSPGDVIATREIAALTIERLAQDYARFFKIEPYLWEYEAMVASGHFQDSIEPPSAFDIVVLIVWSRLGTPLPERTKVREYRVPSSWLAETTGAMRFSMSLRRCFSNAEANSAPLVNSVYAPRQVPWLAKCRDQNRSSSPRRSRATG